MKFSPHSHIASAVLIWCSRKCANYCARPLLVIVRSLLSWWNGVVIVTHMSLHKCSNDTTFPGQMCFRRKALVIITTRLPSPPKQKLQQHQRMVTWRWYTTSVVSVPEGYHLLIFTFTFHLQTLFGWMLLTGLSISGTCRMGIRVSFLRWMGSSSQSINIVLLNGNKLVVGGLGGRNRFFRRKLRWFLIIFVLCCF